MSKRKTLDSFFGLKASTVSSTESGRNEEKPAPVDNRVPEESSSSSNIIDATRPLDISQHKDDELARPLCQFKLTSYGKKGKQRGFSQKWYSTFEWVEYNASAHQAFCFPCSHFGIETEPSFTVSGYHNWKHGLKPHCLTRSHHSSMIAWKEDQGVRSKLTPGLPKKSNRGGVG